MPIFVVFIILAVVLLFYIIGVYNGLQKLRTQIKASIQEIGNQLKRQASLIPNLEISVKSYLKHEKGIFEMLTNARKSIAKAQKTGNVKDIDQAIDDINTMVPQINVTVESNPELKADKTITKFMSELTDTADKLSYARRSVIDLTQKHNMMLVTFPSNMIAGIFGFKAEKGLETPMTGSHVEVSAKEMEDIKVDL
jgi:LemA protein